MIFFSAAFLKVLIYGALGLCCLTVLFLLGLLIKETKDNQIW